MATLHGVLESMRIRWGAPHLDTNEAKILVNKEGNQSTLLSFVKEELPSDDWVLYADR